MARKVSPGPLDWAEWVTDRFVFEKPPVVKPTERAKEYFPDLWPADFKLA